jgi:hypothetical protein
MITNKPVIVIQNTNYHFETTLSIYQSLSSMGLNVYVYRCAENIFDQESFLKQINVNLATKEILDEACCGFVVSSYPNPQALRRSPIPNSDDVVFNILKNKLIYICHRFKDESDYMQDENPINKHNAICLSPLAQRIGLDYFHPIEMPIKHIFVNKNKNFNFTIQAHFNLRGRNIINVIKLINFYKKTNYKNLFKFNFLGVGHTENLIKLKKNASKYVELYECLPEKYFYEIINLNTNFLFCLIDEKIKNETYVKERYSSNFNQSLAFNKPVICHECFKEIYRIPGIYYNDLNLIEKFEEVLNLSDDQYFQLVKSFDLIKEEYKKHNNDILNKKILYLI